VGTILLQVHAAGTESDLLPCSQHSIPNKLDLVVDISLLHTMVDIFEQLKQLLLTGHAGHQLGAQMLTALLLKPCATKLW
jgi:hypothetical protein